MTAKDRAIMQMYYDRMKTFADEFNKEIGKYNPDTCYPSGGRAERIFRLYKLYKHYQAESIRLTWGTTDTTDINGH